MSRSVTLGAFAAFGVAAFAADLPPDTGKDIPKNALRPVVIQLDANAKPAAAPEAILPEGMELITAAGAPLVLHPIMGCLDDRGRLFVGDATGVNWNKKQLEENPPNRVVLLEDANRDGVFDKSTVFADKMTFPQGAAWLNGSLYVCSPPGLWKLTDTNSDGVADKREMIVSGFEYTGNAADVHGPFVHPNGRLYWCHGRKGHKVVGKDGTVVHEGLASGIWSCKPDGRDVQWHSLGCGDNPVEVDFTPEGDIIGVQNLYHSQPRGDTVVHWLYGGVYERSDQMKAIVGLPRTLEHMPVMYNFGHVAVSGCSFYRSGVLFPNTKLPFLVTHFNTQRVVRMDLTPDGSTYKATENEFIKLKNPDIHLTDVMEDADGSVLVIDTGGWFRIGCPASLMAKPDIAGAIYRVRRSGSPRTVVAQKQVTAPKDLAAALASPDMQVRLRACETLAQTGRADDAQKAALTTLLGGPLDPALEHAAIFAGYRVYAADAEQFFNQALRSFDGPSPKLMPRALRIADLCGLRNESFEKALLMSLKQRDPVLSQTAFEIATRHPEMAPLLVSFLTDEYERIVSLRQGGSESGAVSTFAAKVELMMPSLLAQASAQKLMARLLDDVPEIRQASLKVLAAQTAAVVHDDWLPILEKQLADATESPVLLLDALKKLKNPRFDSQLQAIADNSKLPLSIRLKALDAMKSRKITPETFTLLHSVLTADKSSSAVRIQAAMMLAAAPLDDAQLKMLARAVASVGPVELKELTSLCKKTKDVELVKLLASELAKNPSLISQQESAYRTAFSNYPPEIFDTLLLPAIHRGTEAIDAKKRQLAPLADKVIAKGDAKAGRVAFESGKGTCIACHQISGKGRAIGPDLSKIGEIRTERDLIESILFPSNTLARDYEAHVIETGDGQSTMGVIKSHTAEGLLVADIAGQEKNIPHGQIVSDTTLTFSLMPMGLDQTMPEQDLLDLVAYLRSLR